jgi:hypothetical protein
MQHCSSFNCGINIISYTIASEKASYTKMTNKQQKKINHRINDYQLCEEVST